MNKDYKKEGIKNLLMVSYLFYKKEDSLRIQIFYFINLLIINH